MDILMKKIGKDLMRARLVNQLVASLGKRMDECELEL
jgi:hypothetical protein